MAGETTPRQSSGRISRTRVHRSSGQALAVGVQGCLGSWHVDMAMLPEFAPRESGGTHHQTEGEVGAGVLGASSMIWAEHDPCVIGVVFSRDRAMQLEALLNSLVHHCTDIPLLELHVLYMASSPQFKRQYSMLEHRWQDVLTVTFHNENSFRRDLLTILGLSGKGMRLIKSFHRIRSKWSTRSDGGVPTATVPWEYGLFLVDDNVFVRPSRWPMWSELSPRSPKP